MYYKLVQACATNWGSFVLLQIRANVAINWCSFINTSQDKCCYKLGQVLQIRATITNWGIKRDVSFWKSTLTWKQYIFKILIKLIINQFFIYFRIVRQYTSWSVITFVTLIFFYELRQYWHVLIQKQTHLRRCKN